MIQIEEMEKFAKTHCKDIAGETDYINNAAFEGIVEGAKWAKKMMIENVCKWLKVNVNDYLEWYDWEECRVNTDNLLYDFKKAMEE